MRKHVHSCIKKLFMFWYYVKRPIQNGVNILKENCDITLEHFYMILLLLLSRISHVGLCATPIDGSLPDSAIPGILQARTLEWVDISFFNAWKWKVKVKSLSHVGLSNPMNCSLPGSSIHKIFQARVLEWVVIAFSVIWYTSLIFLIIQRTNYVKKHGYWWLR